jgi:hypothetical protein
MNNYLDELKRIFQETPHKHEAHERSRQVLADMSGDASLLSVILEKHLSSPDALNRKHYPVISLELETTPDFELVANCWIPLPDRQTNISTKAIHHHGALLLTTANAFGSGYEHWIFSSATEVDPARELFSMKVIDRQPHLLHNVSFVDAHTPHLPMYPPACTITLALWSSKHPTTWKDKLKRVPLLKRNSAALRTLAARTGLTRQLDLKVVNYFDYYPTGDGFRGMKDRTEFPRGPNEDYLYSLFHVLQQTGNERLASTVRQQLDASAAVLNKPLIEELISKLERGVAIEGRLSAGHYGVPHANFTRQDIERAIAAQQVRENPPQHN